MKHKGLNPSHELSPYLQAAVFSRQLDDSGQLFCAYCGVRLPPGADIQIDHIDGGAHERARAKDERHAAAGTEGARVTAEKLGLSFHPAASHVSPRAHGPSGEWMVAACGACNEALAHHDGQQQLTREAQRSIAHITDRPLPDRSDPGVVALAEEYFGPRLQAEREGAARRRGADPSTAGTGATRAHRAAAAATDDKTPF